jgi:hypothetical protein
MFGGLMNLNEEQRYGLLMAAAQMLQPGPGGTGGAVGRGLERGLMGYQGAMGLKDRRAEEAQQREARGLMMQQQKQQMAEQQGIRDVYSRNTMPGNLAPNDDEGNPMPQAPQGLNLQGLRDGLMAAGPAGFAHANAAGLMPRPKAPLVLAKGARAFGENGQEIAANPEAEKPESRYAKINPADFTPGSFREFAATGDYSKLVPYRKPDTPDKPAKPQLYDSAGGPLWVTPEGSAPVVGPDGKPLQGKKRDQPLTESQARGTLFLGQMREAQEAIDKLKFKPETLTAQAQLASALKAKEAGTIAGGVMNAAAGQDAQQYAQAAEQWAESFLRIKTGAASTRDEVLRNVRTFFPQPGDTAAVIKQKNEARKVANKQMEILAGHGTQQLNAQGGGASGGWGIREIK